MKQTKRTSTATSCLSKTGDFGKGEGRSIHSIHGAMGGRPRIPVDLAKARQFLDQGESIKATARTLGVGEGTLRRALGLARVGERCSDAPTALQEPKGGAL